MRKLLVANRGEIARRIIRSAQARGISTVAVYSDADAGLPGVDEADEAVRLAGYAPSDTYLSSSLLIDAARRTGADALHPGYGFLSENAGFAADCAEAGITFIGPSADAIASMGDKLAAKERVAKAGVPVLRSVEVDSAAGADLLRQASAIGFPVMVKAASGGGGRGMRIVEDPSALEEACASAQREALSAFGDGTVFLERYLEAPRHVEIQVMADSQGKVVHLFERECSIQRRHQKIVEESPCVVLDDDLRRAMGEAAVAAAASVGYVGAGTVEFLLAPDSSFYFLEMNTRLQVEHPVTEAVTGLDLVGLQLDVAAGGLLGLEVTEARQEGHAIEVRLYAEDATREWMPSTGLLRRFEVPAGAFAFEQGVRVDSGFCSGTVVSPHYDPMLAKVISWAPDRQGAALRLARCLRRSRIHGVVTNRDLLVGILEHPDFLAGRTDTAFLVHHDPGVLGASPVDEHAERLHAAAAAVAGQVTRRSRAVGFAGIPSGWRNNPSGFELTVLRGRQGEIPIRYRVGPSGVRFPDDPDVTAVAATEDEVVMDVGGIRRKYLVDLDEKFAYVDSIAGCSELEIVPRFPEELAHHAPGSLLSPMPGAIVRVDVEVGARVERGESLVVLEAMKMEHTLDAPFGGRVVEVIASPGDQVEAGVVLVVVEEEEADA